MEIPAAMRDMIPAPFRVFLPALEKALPNFLEKFKLQQRELKYGEAKAELESFGLLLLLDPKVECMVIDFEVNGKPGKAIIAGVPPSN